MSVKLRKRKNNDGSTSLYLDIYHAGQRHYEFLPNLKLCKTANPDDRQSNKDSYELAEKIAIKRSQELAASDYAMVTDNGKKTIVVEWMQSYVDSYLKKDKRNMQGALNRFKSFLLDRNKQNLTFSHLNELIISDFQDCLMGTCKGEGASSYFSRFKKMIKQAYRNKLIQQNPAAEVKTIQGKPMPRDILTKDEMEKLANTPVSNFNVKIAFLFSCCTGLRWCDVRDLKWQNIDLQEGTLSIRQNKTKQGFTLPLNNTAKALLESLEGKEEKVFTLPSANGANKTLKAWVKRAEINKRITWHNARHSAGTNLIIEGEDATTVREFLGHASTGYVFRYVRVGKAIKNRAADKLNFKI